MCIGIPMQVIKAFETHSICRAPDGSSVEIDTMLVGPQATGNWLMTFLNTARDVLLAEQAAQILDALNGLQQAVAGNDFDHLFADLIDREPELPDFLKNKNN